MKRSYLVCYRGTISKTTITWLKISYQAYVNQKKKSGLFSQKLIICNTDQFDLFGYILLQNVSKLGHMYK